MAGTPSFKVYDENRTYVAAVADAHLAAALVGAAGYNGWSVKFSGRIIWREGQENVRAGESFDLAAETMWHRIHEHREQRNARYTTSSI